MKRITRKLQIIFIFIIAAAALAQVVGVGLFGDGVPAHPNTGGTGRHPKRHQTENNMFIKTACGVSDTIVSCLRPLAAGERDAKKAAAAKLAVEYLRTEVGGINDFITQQVRSLRRVPHGHKEWNQLSWAIWDRYISLLKDLCSREGISGIAEFDRLRQELNVSNPSPDRLIDAVEDLFLDNGYLLNIYFNNCYETDRGEGGMAKPRTYITDMIPRLSVTKVLEDKVEPRDIEGIRTSSRVIIFGDPAVPECLEDLINTAMSYADVTVKGGRLITASGPRLRAYLKYYHAMRLRISEKGQLPPGALRGNDRLRAAVQEFLVRVWPDSEFAPYADKAKEEAFIDKFYPDYKQFAIDHETCHLVLDTLGIGEPESEMYTYLQDLTNPRFCWLRLYEIGVRLAHGALVPEKEHDAGKDFIMRRVIPKLLNKAGTDELRRLRVSRFGLKVATTAASCGFPLRMIRLLPRLPDGFFIPEFHRQFVHLKQESDRKPGLLKAVSKTTASALGASI